jgi:hypothetical protein
MRGDDNQQEGMFSYVSPEKGPVKYVENAVSPRRSSFVDS